MCVASINPKPSSRLYFEHNVDINAIEFAYFFRIVYLNDAFCFTTTKAAYTPQSNPFAHDGKPQVTQSIGCV